MARGEAESAASFEERGASRGSAATNAERSIDAPGSLLRRELRLERIVPAATSAFMVAVLEVVLASSFGALIFAGPLSSSVQAGIGLNLVAGIVMLAVLAVGASQPGTVGSIQDASAAILALVAAGIAARMGPEDPATFFTVVLAIGLTSALAGGVFFTLGTLRVGDLVRFVPYPVVGGFLAATGWLLFKGGTGVMTGTSISMATVPSLFGSTMVTRWLPGLILAVSLLGLLRRYPHFLIIPASLLGSVALFYVVLLASGTSVGEAEAGGWLLGPFPPGGLWRPWALQALGRADWGAIAGQSGNIATIVLLSLLALLLNASGIELLLDRDVDLNRELRVAGAANAASGVAGGVVGFHALSLTALASLSGARSRLVGVAAAAMCGAVLLFGASAIARFPRFVLGGLILFLGLSFLTEWLYDAWFRLSRADYGVVVLILLVVGLVGFLQGVALGLVVAVVLFVVNYSRTDVVRHTLTALTVSSNVERSDGEREILRREGERIHVLQLQGFIFFGTAKTLLDGIAERVVDPARPPVASLVLDFRRVTGIDSSAVMGFAKVLKLAEAQGFTVVLTGLSEGIRRRFVQGGIDEVRTGQIRTFPDLDRGMQWCEDRLLERAPATADRSRPTLWKRLRDVAGRDLDRRRLRRYLTRVEIPQGGYVMRQGEAAEELFFLESGRVTVEVDGGRGAGIRLRTMGPGTVVGELPLYLQTERTASVVAEVPSVMYRLSVEDFRRMERDDPDLAAALHRLFATLLARRLVDSQRAMSALVD